MTHCAQTRQQRRQSPHLFFAHSTIIKFFRHSGPPFPPTYRLEYLDGTFSEIPPLIDHFPSTVRPVIDFCPPKKKSLISASFCSFALATAFPGSRTHANRQLVCVTEQETTEGKRDRRRNISGHFTGNITATRPKRHTSIRLSGYPRRQSLPPTTYEYEYSLSPGTRISGRAAQK